MRRRRTRLVTITSATLTLGCAGLMGPAEPTARITLDERGICTRHVSIDCPPDALCNPPPPEEISCPSFTSQHLTPQQDGTCLQVAKLDCPADTSCSSEPSIIDCPDTRMQSITRAADGTCTGQRVLDCPDRASCAGVPVSATDCPPSLNKSGTISQSAIYGCYLDGDPIACPPMFEPRPLNPDYDVSRNSSGLCTAFYLGSSDCPPDASCNPPMPVNIICPPDVDAN